VTLDVLGVDADFAAAAELGRERAALDERQRELSARVAATAARLADAGWSVRDIGGALQMTTPGRVSQVLAANRAA